MHKATLKNTGSSFLTDMQQGKKEEPLVVGGKGAERMETEKIGNIED
jgi:hypothetical protein